MNTYAVTLTEYIHIHWSLEEAGPWGIQGDSLNTHYFY